MPGQVQPARLVEAFGKNAISDDINYPIPVTSADPNDASLDQGFPPTNFLDPADGGVLPSGADFNGIIRMLSEWCAYLGAGQRPFYDATLAAFMSGYALGAVLAQVADPSATWTNIVDGNASNPDTGGAGWVSSALVYSAAALTGLNNVVLPTPSDCIIDVDCTAGPKAFTGFVAQRPNQRVTLRKSDVSANGLSVESASAASVAANRIQCVAPSLGAPLQYMDFTIQYIPALSRWIQR